MLHWRIHNSIEGPSEFAYPVPEGFIRNPKESGPLCHSHCKPVGSDAMIVSGIIRLLCRCAPLAVLLAVWSVVVNTVEAKPWTVSRHHVTVKAIEGCVPIVAHSNPASTITRICPILLVEATLTHRRPDIVNGMSTHSVFERCPIMLEASTAVHETPSQIPGCYLGVISTVTPAYPANRSVGCSTLAIADDYQSSKPFAEKVDSIVIRAVGVYTCLRHDDSFQSLWSFQPVRPRIGWLYAHSTQSHSPKSTQLFQKRGVS